MTEVKAKKDISSEELSQIVVKGMQERKALNIVVMDMRQVKNEIFRYFDNSNNC